MILGPEIPAAVQEAFRDVEREFVSRQPKAPVKLPAFTEAALPAAADFMHCAVVVTDLAVLAFSDGSAWLNADGSPL